MGQKLPAEAEGTAQCSRQLKVMKPRMLACPLHEGAAARAPHRIEHREHKSEVTSSSGRGLKGS